MSHTQFTEKEVYAIEIYMWEKYTYSQIARKLWKHPSSVSRFVWKYKSTTTWKFSANICLKQRKRLKSDVNKENRSRIKSNIYLEEFILKYIKRYWSPEQISGRWKKETWEKLSKDTIYLYIYEEHPEFIKKYLRRKWKKYQNRRKEKYQLNDRKMIDDRPKVVETRKRIWDWEWDTILWIHRWSKQVILTNVERESGFLLAHKIRDKSGISVLDGTIECFKNIPKYKQKTITYDNGREFFLHRMIEFETHLDVYFAHPYASWERWSNENTNGLLRQFVPKKTDFKNITQNQLKYYVSLINSRPRKRLNYKTPSEVFLNKYLKLCVSC